MQQAVICSSSLMISKKILASMMDGYRNGIITEERLTDALRRILGLKGFFKASRKEEEGYADTEKEGLSVVGCAEHLAMAAEAAKRVSPL